MGVLAILAFIAAPAGAQATLDSDDLVRTRHFKASAEPQPAGPNAQVMDRPATGPNTELLRNEGLLARQVYYPSCAAAGAVRSLPVRRGEPGYDRSLDRDDDGLACEQVARRIPDDDSD
jgi:hypothetical protein